MIPFSDYPADLRVPLFAAEFDSSRAVQGPLSIAGKILVFGQKLVGGAAPANIPVRVTSAAEANLLAGAGSQLYHMMDKLFQNNTVTEKWMIPLDDNGAGVAATGTITFTGPSTGAGVLNGLLAGRQYQVAVASGASPTTMASGFASAVNADPNSPFTASSSVGAVTLTAKNKGLLGNGLDVRFNHYDGEVFPAGVGAVVVAMANGAGNPILTTAISNLGDETQYAYIAFPNTDDVSLTALENELTVRWNAMRAVDGLAIGAKVDSIGNLTTLGAARNAKHVSLVGFAKCPTPSHEIAAAVTGAVAASLNNDHALPVQNLEVIGVIAPKRPDTFDLSERDVLLRNGISTLKVGAGDRVYIERMIVTYKVNAFGAPDTSYYDIEPRDTLSYLRKDWITYISNRYARYKLGKDGGNYGVGQKVMTPKIAKAEAVVKFRDWERMGLVEDADQFIKDLVAEVNLSNPNRLDMSMAPNLINQLRNWATKISYLL